MLRWESFLEIWKRIADITSFWEAIRIPTDFFISNGKGNISVASKGLLTGFLVSGIGF